MNLIKKTPEVSICVPIHDMENGEFFLWRLVNSLTAQTFLDWELVITKDGKMAENTNSAIKKARGKWVKILYLDDYFSHPFALSAMVYEAESGGRDWGVCGASNNQNPKWTDDIETGNNKLGSPSALIFRNLFDNNLLFDERMSWLLDCDYYKRLNDRFGSPFILSGNHVTLGIGQHQMTNILTAQQKLSEHILIKQKYETSPPDRN